MTTHDRRDEFAEFDVTVEAFDRMLADGEQVQVVHPQRHSMERATTNRISGARVVAEHAPVPVVLTSRR